MATRSRILACLESSVDRRAWRATVHGVPKSQRRLSDFHFFLFLVSPVSTLSLAFSK